MEGWVQFFGWGRKKDPPPIQPTRHHEVKASDSVPARSIRNFRSLARWGSRDAVDGEQGWSHSLPRHSDDDDDFAAPSLAQEMAESVVPWEDRLQETIRFVFSHEQGGLLAIGTFALDQLAGVRSGLDSSPPLKPPPPTPARASPPPTPPPTTDQSFCRCNYDFNTQVAFRGSQDDDTEGQHCSPCKRKELPVFGDPDALSSALRGVETTKPLPVHILKRSQLATATTSTTTSSTGTDAPDKYQSDEEFYSPGVCGLFGSRAQRTQKLGENEKRKKLRPEKRMGNSEDQQVAGILQASGSSKKVERAKGCSSRGRLWHPPELKVSEARESPQVPGVPCIANVEMEGRSARLFPDEIPSHPLESSRISMAAEGGERMRVHSFGAGTWACAPIGKWIRTDSEFVVLEM